MSLAIKELAKARDTVASLLDELRLDAYLFEVEPREDQWEVKIEYAIVQGWETVTLPVSKEILLACLDERKVREQLLDDWRAKLSAAKILKT
jgi:hypothetical protein